MCLQGCLEKICVSREGRLTDSQQWTWALHSSLVTIGAGAAYVVVAIFALHLTNWGNLTGKKACRALEPCCLCVLCVLFVRCCVLLRVVACCSVLQRAVCVLLCAVVSRVSCRVSPVLRIVCCVLRCVLCVACCVCVCVCVVWCAVCVCVVRVVCVWCVMCVLCVV